jgi:nicotinamide-nucleotide amidase
LNIEETVIKIFVVSAEVAKEMALNVKNHEYGLCYSYNRQCRTTKGDSKAEIGTVFIALATPKGCC